ncbi:MAG: hypothetical protein ABW040_09965 [Microbacteriaceae bacterium]
MSASLATQQRPSFRPDERSAEQYRHLEIAATRAQKRARPKIVYAIVTISGIVAILLGQLFLSIVVADGAYTVASLQGQQRDLEREQQFLTERLETRSSTQNLIASAERLGMVASGNPVFLDLDTGAVLGQASAAGGSLAASGNLIGNSLVDPSMVIDPEAQAAAAEVAEDAAALEGESTMSPGAPGVNIEPESVSSETESSGPDTLPSPTTR